MVEACNCGTGDGRQVGEEEEGFLALPPRSLLALPSAQNVSSCTYVTFVVHVSLYLGMEWISRLADSKWFNNENYFE